MGAVQGEGADNTRAAAAETAQKRKKGEGKTKGSATAKGENQEDGSVQF